MRHKRGISLQVKKDDPDSPTEWCTYVNDISYSLDGMFIMQREGEIITYLFPRDMYGFFHNLRNRLLTEPHMNYSSFFENMKAVKDKEFFTQ